MVPAAVVGRREMSVPGKMQAAALVQQLWAKKTFLPVCLAKLAEQVCWTFR